MAKFLVLNGLNYPDPSGVEKRAEPGDQVEDIPEKAAKWLARDGHIVPATASNLADFKKGVLAFDAATVDEAEEEEA